jgi:hypothetical protein
MLSGVAYVFYVRTRVRVYDAFGDVVTEQTGASSGASNALAFVGWLPSPPHISRIQPGAAALSAEFDEVRSAMPCNAILCCA